MYFHAKMDGNLANCSLTSLVYTCVLSHYSRVRLFATLWTLVHQALLSMEFSSQGYWSGLSFTLPGDLLDPGIDPASLMSPVLAGVFFTTSPTREAQHKILISTMDLGLNSIT